VKLVEDIQHLQSGLKSTTNLAETNTTKVVQLEKKLNKSEGRAAKREGKVKSPPPSGTSNEDVEALIEERVSKVEEDLYEEVDVLRELAEAKVDTEKYIEQKENVEAWKAETDQTLKDISESVAKATELASAGADVQEYDDTRVIAMVTDTEKALDDKKFNRDEAYLLETSLRANFAQLKEDLEFQKLALDEAVSKNASQVDAEALNELASAIKSKMMAMGNAFHKRFEDLEEQLLGVGGSATRSSLGGLCLSCSRPTATTDHVVRPASPGGNVNKAPSRPGSRQGGQRYFHKAPLYSNTFEGSEGVVLASAQESPAPGESHPLMRPRTTMSERGGGLAPLGRPVDTGGLKAVDGGSFNLSGISTASSVLESPFRSGVGKMRRN